MRRIATNAARDQVRSERGRVGWRIADDTLPAPAGSDPGVRQSVAIAFRRLSPKLYVAAVLALVEQRPYAEIAEALDVPLGTVKARVFRATRLLRRELARLGVTP